jgi:pimeloyl-ACP methyl ester carboxylesterase
MQKLQQLETMQQMFGYVCTPAIVFGLALDLLMLPVALVLHAAKTILGAPFDRMITHNTKLPPMLLVHGLGGNDWEFFPAWLRLRTCYDVYTVQLGIAKSKSCADMARTVAERVRAVRMQTGHARVHVVGHSMGGLVAAAAARDVADSMASLVTIGSPWQGVPLLKHVNFGTQWYRDMTPGSPFLERLAHDSAAVPTMCVAMLGDPQVPWRHALPAPEGRPHDGLILETGGHTSAVAASTTWLRITSWLKRRALPTVDKVSCNARL